MTDEFLFYLMLPPFPSSVISIRGCHPWMTSMDETFIHGWHPQMTLLHQWMTYTDGIFIHGWGFSIHGWNFYPSDFFGKMECIIWKYQYLRIWCIQFSPKNLMDKNSIHGWRNHIHGWKWYLWMSSMDGEKSSVSSMDGDNEWGTWTERSQPISLFRGKSLVALFDYQIIIVAYFTYK